jgi:polygalacturonase
VCEALEGRLLLAAIPQPTIPSTLFDVTTFGAVGNGTSNNAGAIQNAINAASAAGGGVVEIPLNGSNVYITGPLTLASNINLEIDQGVTLQALPMNLYPGGGGSAAVTPLITGHNITNFEITGRGTIDGQGAAWYTAFNANSSIARPSIIQLSNVQTVVLLNFTIANSPQQAVLFGASSGVAGNNVTINDVTVTAPSNSPGTDGLDIAGSNFLLEGCSINVGGTVTLNEIFSGTPHHSDVSLGGNNIGISPQLVACSNIDIEDCHLGSGLGITVGPQTTQGLNGLAVNNSVFTGTSFGIRLISGRGNGGLVQNVNISNITMTNVLNDLVINDYYVGNTDLRPINPTADAAQSVTASTPKWQNITFTNLRGDNLDQNSALGQMIGLAEAPIQTVVFTNVILTGADGIETDHAHGVTLDLATTLTTAFDDDDATFFFPDFYDQDINDTPLPTNLQGLVTAFDSTITINPMQVLNIGSPSTPGTAVYSTHYFDAVLSGTGASFSGTSDQFVFDGTPIYGNTTLNVPMVNITSASSTAAAGIMIRESLAPNAAFVFVGLVNDGTQSLDGAMATPTVEISWRANDGGTVQTESLSTGPSSATGFEPSLKLQRIGTDFEVFLQVPMHGVEQIAQLAINMTQASYMGTAVTSGGSPSLATADFGGPIYNLPLPMAPGEPTEITAVGLTYPATFIEPLTASPNPVLGTSTTLTTLAIASNVEGNNVAYGFENTVAPNAQSGAGIAGTDVVGQATATFSALGSYTFISELSEDSIISLQVTVIQTATTIGITPAPVAPDTNVELESGQQQQFSASALDQFGASMAVQPTFTFSLGAGSEGSITPQGLYTAGPASGTATIVATANGNSGTQTVNITDQAPTVGVAAAATPSTVAGTTSNLSVLGADDAGEGNLTYTWSATGPAAVLFSTNGTNGAKSSVATFAKAGSYILTATITDGGALTTTSAVAVTVSQTPTIIAVNPPSVVLVANATKQFAISGTDQFGDPLTTPPVGVWSLVAGSIGSITSGGRYTAPGTSGSATVRVTLGGLTATGTVLVNTGPPSVVTGAAATVPTVTGTTASLSSLGDDGAGESTLIYTWTVAGPAGVSFSANGTNGAKNTVATFIKAGMYSFVCVIMDQSGLTATTSVHVSVTQTVTAIAIGPTSITLAGNGHQQFTAAATDQFGNAMTVRPHFVWTLGNGSIGTLSALGRYVAPLAAGSATVIATVGAVSSSPATVTVDVATDSGTPTFSQNAQASATSTTSNTVDLSAVGIDPLAGTIIYRWLVSGPAPVRLSANNSAAAGSVTATFHAVGTYNFTVLIKGSSGEFAATGVSVTVTPVVTTLRIMPLSARMLMNKTRQFRAVARDQFGHLIANPPFTWSLTGGSVGSIGLTGLFSSGGTPGAATVQVAAGLLDADAPVTVLA